MAVDCETKRLTVVATPSDVGRKSKEAGFKSGGRRFQNSPGPSRDELSRTAALLLLKHCKPQQTPTPIEENGVIKTSPLAKTNPLQNSAVRLVLALLWNVVAFSVMFKCEVFN